MAKKKSTSAGSATAVAEPPKGVRVEDVGPCRKKLSFEIAPDKVAGLISEKFDGLSAGAVLPGFRAGRAPRSLVEKRFGAAVREEAKQQLVLEAYQEAVKDHELRVLGEPEGGDELRDAALDGGKALKFTLEVEVAPEITLPSLDGFKVKKPLIEVTDEMVQRELDRMATNEGTLESRERCETGDYCVGHGVMKNDDGKVVLDIPGAVIQSPTPDKKGEGMVLGVKVADFGKQLGKPKAGDSVVIKTMGPANHENESVRGKPVTVEFKVDEVHHIAPASVEQLLAKFGMQGEQQLREAIALRLNQRVMIEQQSAMRQQIAKHLIETVKFDLPEQITARQSARNLERRRFELMHRGVDPKAIEENMADLRAASTEVAGRELKLFFILDKAARDINIQVTEGEVNGRIAQMAMSRGQRPEQLRAELIRTGQAGGVVQQIREHKALDALLAKATVDEVSLEAYNKTTADQG